MRLSHSTDGQLVGNEPPEVSNRHSVETMRRLDAMLPVWRALVYEYGMLITEAMQESLNDIDQAEFALMQRRYNMQQEWLATDFVTPDMIEAFKRGIRRMR